MKNISKLSAITLVTIFASLALGCGGGGSDDKKDGGGINIGGNGGGNGGGYGSTPQDISGRWVSPCLKNSGTGKAEKIAYVFEDNENGVPVYGKVRGIYNTDNSCLNDNAPDNSVVYVGAAEYNGTTAASVCTAYNFDSVYQLVKVGNNEYRGQALKTFLSNNGDNGSATGIVCALNGKVALNQSSANSSQRPRDVIQRFYFTKITSKYIEGTSLTIRLLDALHSK